MVFKVILLSVNNMHFITFATLGLALGTSFASPTPRGHVRHEKRVENGLLIKRGRADPSMQMPVRIALAQNNIEYGSERLMDISDPRSANFGKHMTAEEVGNLFRPSPESISTVRDWLHGAGIETERQAVSLGKGFLRFNASIGELETLLSTKYHVYAHTFTKETHIGCDEYHLPTELVSHIDFLTPSVSTIPIKRQEASQRGKRAQVKSLSPAAFPPHTRPAGITPNSNLNVPCHTAVTPACIRGKFNSSYDAKFPRRSFARRMLISHSTLWHTKGKLQRCW